MQAYLGIHASNISSIKRNCFTALVEAGDTSVSQPLLKRLNAKTMWAFGVFSRIPSEHRKESNEVNTRWPMLLAMEQIQ